MILQFIRKNSGFTLVETITALVVVCISSLLLVGSLELACDNQKRQNDDFQMDFDQFTTILYSDDLDLVYKGKVADKEKFDFYSLKNQHEYSLRYDGQKLWLLKDGRGYMPLMYQVSTFKLTYQKNTQELTVAIKAGPKTFTQTVVMAQYEQE